VALALAACGREASVVEVGGSGLWGVDRGERAGARVRSGSSRGSPWRCGPRRTSAAAGPPRAAARAARRREAAASSASTSGPGPTTRPLTGGGAGALAEIAAARAPSWSSPTWPRGQVSRRRRQLGGDAAGRRRRRSPAQHDALRARTRSRSGTPTPSRAVCVTLTACETVTLPPTARRWRRTPRPPRGRAP
jgi:hypothetical protein